MHTIRNIRGHFLLALALGLPLAAQVPTGDYVSIRIQANEALEGGSYSEAQRLFQQALELRRQAFGENSAAYAAALVDLARAYQAEGKRSAEATKLYQQALPIQETTLGADHPDVATTLYYLAMGTPNLAEYKDQARQLYQRALDIRTKAFGASDRRVAEILTPLARLTGDEALYQRALAILDASAPQSPAAATTLELYAHFLHAHQRDAEAEPMEARAKLIRVERVQQIGLRGDSPGGSPGTAAMRVGGGVTAPKLKQKTEPEYTDAARADKWQGTVLLSVEVGADGLAHNIQLKRGIGLGLDEKAADAVSKWKFVPGTKDGQPVTVLATIEVNFRLL